MIIIIDDYHHHHQTREVRKLRWPTDNPVPSGHADIATWSRPPWSSSLSLNHLWISSPDLIFLWSSWYLILRYIRMTRYTRWSHISGHADIATSWATWACPPWSSSPSLSGDQHLPFIIPAPNADHCTLSFGWIWRWKCVWAIIAHWWPFILTDHLIIWWYVQVNIWSYDHLLNNMKMMITPTMIVIY